jgi:signal transduction histidine kinase
MPSRFFNRVHKTLAFRLTFWYSAIFILSSLTLFIVSYLFVFSAVRDNRSGIEAQLSKYQSLVESRGIGALESVIQQQRGPSRRSTFFVRIVDANNATLLLSHPWLWEKFDFARVPNEAEGRWHYYTSRKDGGLLEVASVRLTDKKLLQVGKSIQDREEVLERFRETLLATLILMVFLCVAFRQIRNVITVTGSIVDADRFDARVPVNEAGDDLNEMVVLFNQMLAKIEALIAGMKNALDNVAHDLRTPVTRLRGMAEQALRSEAGEGAMREALADCLEESERVVTMLNTLMDISEAETGTTKLSIDDVNLSALVEEVVELYEYVAEEKSVALSTRAPTHLYLRGDRGRLRQVIANLVDNAIKYTAGGGRVEIEAFQKDEQAVVIVRDTGIGIPPDELPRIWDRLFRGDKSRSQRGLGLGLSLVKAVVQAHRGQVEASPNPAGGSVFALYLPLSRAA